MAHLRNFIFMPKFCKISATQSVNHFVCYRVKEKLGEYGAHEQGTSYIVCRVP